MLLTLNSFDEEDKYKLYGFCIMDNHMHLFMEELEDGISTSINRICSRYVFWYNKKYDRIGHLFQERFKSEAVENEDYFVTVLRYIHQNPIKAGITKEIDYKCSSYVDYTNKASIIDIDLGLSLFSKDRKKAIKLFTKYHMENNDDICLDYKDNIKLSYSEARDIVNEMRIENIFEIQNLNKIEGVEVLRILKKIKGISIRQLSRITGISKSLIDSV